MESTGILAALWAAVAMVVTWLVLAQLRKHRMNARLASAGLGTQTGWGERLPFDLGRPLQALGERLQGRLPGEHDRLQKVIDAAGLNGRVAVSGLLAWKVIGLVAGALIGVGVVAAGGAVGAVLAAGLMALGWFGPNLWLMNRRATREQAISRALPLVMDVLSLSLAAGMGLDRALRVLCERMPSAATQEFERVFADIDAGLLRSEAFRRMARRVRLEEVQMLSGAIIQTEQLGTSLAPAIQATAARMRVTRRHRAQIDALRAPVKMALPMVALILPAIFIVIMGPAALQIVAELSGVR